MENYIALLLLVVPGFISRRIYGLLSSHRSAKNTFEETIYSLIFSVFNIIGIYGIFHVIAMVHGGTKILNKDTFLWFFTNPKMIVMYAAMALLSSILIALIWNRMQPGYMWAINKIKSGDGESKVIVSGSVFKDTFGNGEVHFVELYKEDKMLARGILSKMHQEECEFYLEDAEPEIDFFIGEDGKIIGYKGHYLDIKNNLVIKEIDTSKHK